jgi:hypothetical protein
MLLKSDFMLLFHLPRDQLGSLVNKLVEGVLLQNIRVMSAACKSQLQG